MKLIIKNKIVVIVGIVLLVVLIIVGVFLYQKYRNDSLINNAYIDIWEDSSIHTDIDLYSEGTGLNEKIYLGWQPVHYLISKNGDVYKYQESSYKNKITGIRDRATVEFIKQLSQSDLEKLESVLKLLIKNYEIDDSFDMLDSYWCIKINGELTKVRINLVTLVLNSYLK